MRVVEKLTRYVIEPFDYKFGRTLVGELEGDEQYIILKHCFSVVHSFFTSNNRLLNEVCIKLDTLAKEKKKRKNYFLNPWSYVTEVLVDEAFISMLLSYSNMQLGEHLSRRPNARKMGRAL